MRTRKRAERTKCHFRWSIFRPDTCQVGFLRSARKRRRHVNEGSFKVNSRCVKTHRSYIPRRLIFLNVSEFFWSWILRERIQVKENGCLVWAFQIVFVYDSKRKRTKMCAALAKVCFIIWLLLNGTRRIFDRLKSWKFASLGVPFTRNHLNRKKI